MDRRSQLSPLFGSEGKERKATPASFVTTLVRVVPVSRHVSPSSELWTMLDRGARSLLLIYIEFVDCTMHDSIPLKIDFIHFTSCTNMDFLTAQSNSINSQRELGLQFFLITVHFHPRKKLSFRSKMQSFLHFFEQSIISFLSPKIGATRRTMRRFVFGFQPVHHAGPMKDVPTVFSLRKNIGRFEFFQTNGARIVGDVFFNDWIFEIRRCRWI